MWPGTVKCQLGALGNKVQKQTCFLTQDVQEWTPVTSVDFKIGNKFIAHGHMGRRDEDCIRVSPKYTGSQTLEKGSVSSFSFSDVSLGYLQNHRQC